MAAPAGSADRQDCLSGRPCLFAGPASRPLPAVFHKNGYFKGIGFPLGRRFGAGICFNGRPLSRSRSSVERQACLVCLDSLSAVPAAAKSPVLSQRGLFQWPAYQSFQLWPAHGFSGSGHLNSFKSESPRGYPSKSWFPRRAFAYPRRQPGCPGADPRLAPALIPGFPPETASLPQGLARLIRRCGLSRPAGGGPLFFFRFFFVFLVDFPLKSDIFIGRGGKTPADLPGSPPGGFL